MLQWLQALLADHGYGVVFLIVFLNNLGLPVPGDMMLLGAGLLAQQGILSLGMTIAVGTAACFLGGSGAYWLGFRFGIRLFKKMRWLQFTPKRAKGITDFFKKHGAKAVFFARFIALLHPVTGFLAGMGKTPWKPFLFYNLAGSAAYALIYSMAGSFFGERRELIKIWMGHIILYAVLFFVLVVILFLGLLFWNFIHAFFSAIYSKKNSRE